VARGILLLKGVKQRSSAVHLDDFRRWRCHGRRADGEARGIRIGTGEWAATNVNRRRCEVKFKVKLRKAG